MDERLTRTIDALKANNMAAYFVETKDEAKKLALSLINKGDTVSVGGSVTLQEIGILEGLRCGDYNFLDRYNVATPEEVHEIFRKSFFADAYFTSSNAVTENGELYNVDGNGNRVAAIIYGPKSVIVIVGKNKIVKDLDEAQIRVKSTAAPLNCKRLERDTYCCKAGHCASLDSNNADCMTAGCRSAQRICRDYVVCGAQAIKDRIKVIIVNEDLGY